MKRCPAIHMPVAKATRIVALAHCMVHARALVTKVDQFDVFAARGVTGHHDSRRRDDHQGQGGEDDADQFQSALVGHRKNVLPGMATKSPAGVPARAFRLLLIGHAIGERDLLPLVPDIAS